VTTGWSVAAGATGEGVPCVDSFIMPKVVHYCPQAQNSAM
jgi:hypothetical protein